MDVHAALVATNNKKTTGVWDSSSALPLGPPGPDVNLPFLSSFSPLPMVKTTKHFFYNHPERGAYFAA